MKFGQEFANVTILLLLALMFIGTYVSTAIGAGLLIGSTIVVLWNLYR